MKKFLLTAALVLALVVSLTAGTMAFYTTTVGTINTKNETKSFSITADRASSNYATVVELAPGDTVVYTIPVHNKSEVSAITKFVATLTNQFNLPGLNVKVARASGNENAKDTYDKVAFGDTGTGADAVAPEVDGYMTIGSTDIYTVTVTWARGSEWDADTTAKYQAKSFYLSFDISGYQAENEGVTYNGETGSGI